MSYEQIVSVENLLLAWEEFVSGKKAKRDVQEFSLHLMDNILALHDELASKTYKHGGYHHFRISDPKPRDIHKASVRDRLVHHAIYRILYPFFDKKFIADSYSCRLEKGTHRALNRFRDFAFIVSKNHTRTCWVLKCDIRKFFANIDHQILMNILKHKIIDEDILSLLGEVIESFHTVTAGLLVRRGGMQESPINPWIATANTPRNGKHIGLPLGNLTSQLLVNIYMNEFDQFVKHSLKEKYYIRYADDFVFLWENRGHLEKLVAKISEFLCQQLGLALHPDKLFLKTFQSGVDFLGWVHFPDHQVLRTASKKRMMRTIRQKPTKPVLISYQGLLSHGNAFYTRQMLEKQYKLFADKSEIG